MKVLHTPYTYFPNSSGGTEVYVRALTRELQMLGVENLITEPAASASAYAHERVVVQRLATSTR